MKIGLVRRGHSATGGAESYLLRLAAGLKRSGHEPVLITSEHWPEGMWPFGGVIRLPGASPDGFAAAFSKTDTGCDVHLSLERVPGCEAFRAGDGVHAAWLERRERFESPWKRWMRRFNSKHGKMMQLEREVFDPQNTRIIIANCRMVRDEILERFEFPADRIKVVYNGIGAPLPRIDKLEARQRLGVPEDVFCALFVGTGWERKGLRFAVNAMKRMKKVRLLVAGRGPASAYASPSTIFLGPVKDLSAVFSAADVFVLPTIYDPFSNACLEALAIGLPVVTTSSNGFSEILTPGVTGSVVEAGDSWALAEALSSWRDRDAEVVRQACSALAAEYSIDRNVALILEALEEARSLG